MIVLRRIASLIPLWLWALAAVGCWGAWQHHAATKAADTLNRAQASAAAEQAQAASAAAAETQRRTIAAKEIDHDARNQTRLATRDSAAARARAQRVRSAIVAAVPASGAAGDPATSEQLEAATSATLLCADLLSRSVARAAELADMAHRSRIAGQSCERQYEALSAPLKPIEPVAPIAPVKEL